MNIEFITNLNLRTENNPLEVVERKGIGHPDTLADLVAEMFSKKYIEYCLNEFWVILNYWVDKITLTWWDAHVDYWEWRMKKNIGAYLFWKVTKQMWDREIDIDHIFRQSVEIVFESIFWKEILNYISYHVDLTQCVWSDFVKTFYSPRNIDDFKNNLDLKKSNDTIVCSGFWPYTYTERLTISLENFINSEEFKDKYPATWWDVKIMVVRQHRTFNITVCIPFIAKLTPTFDFYSNQKKSIYVDLISYIEKLFLDIGIFWSFELKLNTKDYATFGYLTVFWTALDKWDVGAVGRGNKYSWIISNIRDANVEAVAWKSITRHWGKIYTILAYSLAHILAAKYKANFMVTIVSNNGVPLDNPSRIFISSDDDTIPTKEISAFLNSVFCDVFNLAEKSRNIDPINQHKKRSFLY